MTTSGLGDHMKSVALALLGEPDRYQSKGADIRFGTNGSMSVNLEKGTFYSHEDKKGGGVLDLIKREKGLEPIEAIAWMRDTLRLDVGRERGVGPKASGAQSPKGSACKEIQKTYDYTDEEGGLIFQTVRYVFRNPDGTLLMAPGGKPSKTFLQRHRDPKTGEWVWNVKGVRLVPYRLPELVRAVAGRQTVYIVEGEAKVDLLRRSGLQATCNPMGAGKWPKEFTPYFAGANVVVLPDNDPQAKQEGGTLRFHADSRPVLPGQDHAQTVATFLHGTANSIKVLMLPDLPVKGDVIEWFAAGRTAEELLALAEEAPEYSGPVGRPDGDAKATTHEPYYDDLELSRGVIEPAEPIRPTLFNGTSTAPNPIKTKAAPEITTKTDAKAALEPPPAEPWGRNPATIPPREYLFGDHFIRGACGTTIGGGGRGKTTLSCEEAVSMVVGRDLMTGEPLKSGPLSVWMLNGEEVQDEIDRRICAVLQHYKITVADLGGRLWAQSVRDRPMRIAMTVKGVPMINDIVVGQMVEFINRNKIDVFMIDPLVSFHDVPENDNSAMDKVIKQGFGAVTCKTNSAGELFHHPGKPKPGQSETTVEDGRGASAILCPHIHRSACAADVTRSIERTIAR
jgi:hypothetical protein